jgi:hypothetical protein
VVTQGAAYRCQGPDPQWYESGTRKRVLTLANAKQCTVLPHIMASVFIDGDESGLHHDYEVWLEELAPRGRQTWRARGQRPTLTLALTHSVLDATTANPMDHTFG